MDTENPTVTDSTSATTVENQFINREGAGNTLNALSIDLDDTTFIKTAKKLIADSESKYESKYKLKKRRQTNERFLFGRQDEDKRFKKYNSKHQDNIIWEAESYIKPMALSRMPTITVTPGREDPEAQEQAKAVSKVVNNNTKSRIRRRSFAMAHKHMPVYFVGAIKRFWNPEKGKNGDYDERVIHPEYLVLDYAAQTNNPRDMRFIAETVEYSVKEWVMKFPQKEQEFYKELKKTGVFAGSQDEKTEAGMNTLVKGTEIWFTWYQKKGDAYEALECVGWYYNTLVFDKIKHPYWDWTGDPQVFKYDQPAKEQDLQQALMGGDTGGLETQKVFSNYLDYPDKPYILLGYDQWGKTPLDETSRIEQAIKVQESLDKRGRQITEMLDRARGKHVFSAMEGLKAEDIEEMDMSDPEEDLLVKGEVNKVHSFIAGEQPSPAMIQNQTEMRERIFDKMGVHGPARGQVDMGSPATNNQISREGDFSRNDDLVEDTINYAAEQMARWDMQLIRLFYTEEHLVKDLGEDGKTVFDKITKDYVHDGMEVIVSASGTDKLKAEQRAMDMAKLNKIDPLSFYIDLGVSDPKGRAEKLMLFLTAPELYVQKFITPAPAGAQLAGALGAQEPAGSQPQSGGAQQATQDIMQITQGIVPSPPTAIDPSYLQTFMSFIQSPQLEQVLSQFPQSKPQVIQFIEQIKQLAMQMSSPQGQPQGQPSAPPIPSPNGQGPVGPVGNSPSPLNTSRVAITPPGV